MPATNIGKTAHHSSLHGHLAHPHYRPDIDGLRAIAILSVMGFHAFPKWMPGGFIGVDIFFIISGYLISTIILQSLKRGNFSFTEFYIRRIRRIFPALLVVLIACFLFGWLVLLADEYKQLGKHIVGGAGFFSNFLLKNEAGYFDNTAETKPLLHLWSLGIEEQFYIVWPLLLWGAWRTRYSLLAVMLIICVASFALNISKITNETVATFYLPQTRFWELMLGSLLAHIVLHKSSGTVLRPSSIESNGQNYNQQISICKSKPLHNLLSSSGFILICLGFLVITKERVFPGWWALLPTLGAALIISAGQQAILNRIVLSNRILVWCGLVSFPLYLWHWPLLSFARIVEGSTPTYKVRIAAMIVSGVLAWLTYLLIEKPVRYGQKTIVKTLSLLTLMVIVGYAGYDCYRHDGLEFREANKPYLAGDVDYKKFFGYLEENFYRCTPERIYDEALIVDKWTRCYQSKTGTAPTVAIIGDSHAEHLFVGLSESYKNVNFVYYIKESLPFVSQPDFSGIFDYLVADKKITKIVISAHWAGKISQLPPNSYWIDDFEKSIRKLLRANKQIYIFDDVPFFPFDPHTCIRNRFINDPAPCIIERPIFDEQQERYLDVIQKFAAQYPNVHYVETGKYFCNRTICSMRHDNQILFRDYNHLNVNGSQYLGKMLKADLPALFGLEVK